MNQTELTLSHVCGGPTVRERGIFFCLWTQTKGELSHERRDKQEVLNQNYAKLINTTQQFSDALDEPMPELTVDPTPKDELECSVLEMTDTMFDQVILSPVTHRHRPPAKAKPNSKLIRRRRRDGPGARGAERTAVGERGGPPVLREPAQPGRLPAQPGAQSAGRRRRRRRCRCRRRRRRRWRRLDDGGRGRRGPGTDRYRNGSQRDRRGPTDQGRTRRGHQAGRS